jgi:hypothetical protein
LDRLRHALDQTRSDADSRTSVKAKRELHTRVQWLGMWALPLKPNAKPTDGQFVVSTCR